MKEAKIETGNNDQISGLNELIAKAKTAQAVYAAFTQEQVDAIFRNAAIRANEARIPLAKEAVAESGMGIVEDKVIKNHFAAEYIYNKYKDARTCGVIEEDNLYGIKKVLEPVGIIAGVVPTTNPTSTAIFKALLALKTRNAIVFSPHPRAKKATAHAAKIIHDAAVEAGAPANLVLCIEEPTIDASQHLMSHPDISLILATGGPGMVKAAYSSGTPAIGVGAGNTPAIIDETADILMAVSSIMISKSFDNGMICASEQSVVVHKDVYDEVKAEFERRGGYILKGVEREKVAAIILKNGKLNAAIVGQRATTLAELAGITVPPTTKVLIGETKLIDKAEPFTYEKLSPILAMYRADDFEEAVQMAYELVEFGGLGHTSVVYTDPANRDRIDAVAKKIRTCRVLVNMPSSQGAIGDIYNFRLEPSLTLGCGSWGHNAVSENVGIKHLMNYKTIAERRENMLWFRLPPKIYFKNGSLPVALGELKGKKRAFIVTDKPLYDLGYTKAVTKVLSELGVEYEIFHDVKPDPTRSTIEQGLKVMDSFAPDVIIALGGGSPMDAAKIMWLAYEDPKARFELMSMRFMDIRKRVYDFPELGRKAILITVPTTSGTGSEVTPFAIVTDDVSGAKYAIADYALTPTMAIIDASFVMNMPKSLTAFGGIDALVHAIEAYVSIMASDYSDAMALDAIKLITTYLPRSYEKGAADPEAREKMHNAATIAGIAFANAFLGICHSMAHKLGAAFHIPHGLANALLITDVIRYNATDVPFKQAAFPQYKYPNAKARYAKIADSLALGGSTEDEKVEKLIDMIQELKSKLNIPSSIREYAEKYGHFTETEFRSKLDTLAENAFDDQCTGSNPRYPLISELKELYVKAFNGPEKLSAGTKKKLSSNELKTVETPKKAAKTAARLKRSPAA